MAGLGIEVDRGGGWHLRAESDASMTVAELLAGLPQYPHRAFPNGAQFGEITPSRGNRLSANG